MTLRTILLFLFIISGIFTGVMAADTYDDLIIMGDSLFDREKYSDALAIFDAAITIDTTRTEGYEKKALSLYYLNRFEDALIAVNAALKINGDIEQILDLKNSILDKLQEDSGKTVENDSKFRDAEIYHESVPTSDSSEEVIASIDKTIKNAKKDLENGKSEEARDAYKDALRESASADYFKGFEKAALGIIAVFEKSGRSFDALTWLKGSSSPLNTPVLYHPLGMQSAELWYNLGRLYEKVGYSQSGDYEEKAIEAYTKALSLDPTHNKAKFNLNSLEQTIEIRENRESGLPISPEPEGSGSATPTSC